ncbi:hypothetical protein [Hymenobacter sp. CRA2]|uniref:hypothetical protein n=1 Tax=Hymenobacter sp. CRA2 TaxID=1955620 RepID=UPI001117A44B|nr:hypothetical protein [Hymenobacter sp. CRA2]
MYIVHESAICCASLLAYVTWLSPETREGRRNRSNSKYVKRGMNMQQVLVVMGHPDRIAAAGTNAAPVYYYKPPFGASSEVTIFFQ